MMRTVLRRRSVPGSRDGATLVLTAAVSVILVGMVAFAVDVGVIALTKTQLQNAADSAALAGAAYSPSDEEQAVATARQFAAYHMAAGKKLNPDWVDVEIGSWDSSMALFTPGKGPGGAVRVTIARDAAHGGELPLFFAPVLGVHRFSTRASAVAMPNPRDIVFVIDLSGSMNDDTEPCWATHEIERNFGPLGFPTVATDLMQMLYDDFGFGTFPGTLQHVGQPLGVTQDGYAYARLTKDGGPLTPASIPSEYRIASSNSESTRRVKAYKWMIDNQIAAVMPNAKPTPVSSSASSYSYWERYLDYILRPRTIGSSSPGGQRPSVPVVLPPDHVAGDIGGFGNPYTDAYPDADVSIPDGYLNKIGYRTYVQFMMDFGRDVQPVAGKYTPLSTLSPYCPRHNEVTDGGTFSFPPREQPTHATRRAVIAALQVIKAVNEKVFDSNERDWVSIVTFDRTTRSAIRHSLSFDYDAAMQVCTTFQAVGDTRPSAGESAVSTATEAGLVLAKNHIASIDEGGVGRRYTNKVVVLLTDGVPNLHTSPNSVIDDYIGAHPSDDFLGADHSDMYVRDKNAALMQCAMMQSNRWRVFPVGIGLGADYDFMDRSARRGGTANKDGQGFRGSGNPAQYEQRLKDIFQKIITNPMARLVQ